MTLDTIVATLKDFWATLTSVQQAPSWGTIALGLCLALLLLLPRVWSISRNLATVAHEGGHALVGLLFGRRIAGIKLHSDTSGVTISSGNPRGLGAVFTMAAGYPFPGVVGLGMAYLLSVGRVSLLVLLLTVLLILMLLSIRNFWGALIMLPLSLGFYALRFLDLEVQSLALVTIAGFLSAASLRTIGELARQKLRGEAQDSDPDQLQKLTWLPAWLWIGVFALSAGAATLLTAILLLRSATGEV